MKKDFLPTKSACPAKRFFASIPPPRSKAGWHQGRRQHSGTIALTRLLSSLLFGVSATDPLTFVGVAILLIPLADANLPSEILLVYVECHKRRDLTTGSSQTFNQASVPDRLLSRTFPRDACGYFNAFREKEEHRCVDPR